MKGWISVFLGFVILSCLGLSSANATTTVDSPFPVQSPDQTVALSVTDLGNSVDHAVVFYNHVANTAVAVVLNSVGIPDNFLLGNAYVAADFNVNPAEIWTSNDLDDLLTSPFPAGSPDRLEVLPAEQLNGFDHAVIFVNQTANTAMAAVLDPEGMPDNLFVGYAFLAADLGTGTIWGTSNGIGWNCISVCE